MYLDYYKLAEQPFGVTPNPRYLYLSSTHREAMASIWHGVTENRGFTAMIAHPGMGKTTLLFNLLQKAPASLKTVFLFQTLCSPRDLLRNLLADLGVSSDGQDLAHMQTQLNGVLIQEAAAGRRVVVVIDEAQNLDEPAMEVLRVLSNFETSDEKLMHVVLAGQPDLARKLSSPSMVQLRQRVSVVARLAPFNAGETREYMKYRLCVAGYRAARPLFSDRACDLIAMHSHGIPRNINNICFNAMALGCALQKEVIGPEIVREVLEDLDLEALTKQSFSPSGPAPSFDRRPYRRAQGTSWLRGGLIRTGLMMAAILLSLTILLAACNVNEPGASASLVAAPTSTVARASASPNLDQRMTGVDPLPHDGALLRDAESSPNTQTVGERDQSFTVQMGPGETLYGICLRYFGRYDGKILQRMETLNPGLGDPKRIYVGRTVRLPSQETVRLAEQTDLPASKMEEEKQ
ncbi:MAG TPA: AAA family ATPase [Candidatus Acidoferrum sp.]|nr:AAA family ATPase [Candidatus Acidoferrum sp.]